MIEDIIETCHNGIVSWDNPSLVQPILIQGKNDHEKTIQRWKIVKDLFKEKGIDYREIFSIDGNLLSKLMSLIYLFDYTSIYHSVLFKIDPSPLKRVILFFLNKNSIPFVSVNTDLFLLFIINTVLSIISVAIISLSTLS